MIIYILIAKVIDAQLSFDTLYLKMENGEIRSIDLEH